MRTKEVVVNGGSRKWLWLPYTDSLKSILVKTGSYPDGIRATVRETDEDDNVVKIIGTYELLRGSKLAIDIRHSSVYGYHECLAAKIGKVARQRMKRDNSKFAIIKCKTDVFSVGNYGTRSLMTSTISGCLNQYKYPARTDIFYQNGEYLVVDATDISYEQSCNIKKIYQSMKTEYANDRKGIKDNF